MNKEKLDKVFEEIKTATKMNYAITNADEYGDCSSCVNYALGIEFGFLSKGIWIKHWLKGMNKGCKWEDLNQVVIEHDIEVEQAFDMIEIFENNGYEVNPKYYDSEEAFTIKERE